MTLPNCLDCGKQLSNRRSVRCCSCAGKKVWSEKERKPPNTCVDCGTPIERVSTRCVPCYHKYRSGNGQGLDIDIRAKISASLSGASFEEAKADLLERDQRVPLTTEEIHQKIHKAQQGTGRILPVGTVRVGKHGYLYEKIGHYKGRRGWVLQHRVVMAEHLGHPLTSDEHVHHIDNDPANNALDNLALVNRREHYLINKVVQFIKDPRGGTALARVIVKTIRLRFPDAFHDTTSMSGKSSSI